LAVFCYFQDQIPDKTFEGLSEQVHIIFGMLLASHVLAQISFPLAVLSYIIFTFYVSIQYYQSQSIDTADQIMVMISTVNGLLFMFLVLVFSWVSPFMFAHPSIFQVLLVWNFVTNFGVSYGANFWMPKPQKLNFFVKTGFLSWITTVVMLFMFLFARGDLELLLRLVEIRGTGPFVFVVFPVLNLVSSYFFSAIGYLNY